ncbi:response regulator [Nitrosospira multiformis]|nr:response regulator [Nitrosospira multiformis]
MVIETTVGRGTAISLFVPALEGDTNEGSGSLASGNEKALGVDDQADVLDITIELFQNMGYDVLSANTGENALEILKKTPDIDVLFSDVVMPGMNGIDLAREARILLPNINIKVILASGYNFPASRAENSPMENFRFVRKPYRISEIAKMLRMAD